MTNLDFLTSFTCPRLTTVAQPFVEMANLAVDMLIRRIKGKAGPPYSSPSFIQLLIVEDEEIEVRSEREMGTALWKHQIFRGGRRVGEMTDFVDAEIPCMIRRIHLEAPLNFTLVVREGIQVLNNTRRFAEWDVRGALLAIAEAGTYIYGRYPSPKGLVHQILGRGAISFREGEDKNAFGIRCEPGESLLNFVGGPTYPECIENTENILKTDYGKLSARTRARWRDFTSRRHDFAKSIPKDVPQRELLLKTIDDISILIKVQQGVEGGVLAGHNYHLGYVRDQYGVFRCLMKLGYLEEAKAIIDFYWNIWKRYGSIHNAQAIGVDGIFHVHENDEVEITGYLIVQAFDYYERSGDDALLKEIFPMLEWAWDSQKKHLIKYMLPFNGDETYVAGGILPRSALNDGSAEATLLFIAGGEKLLRWAEKNRMWTDDKLVENQRALQETRDHYRENFWEGDRLPTNNPDRTVGAELPRFRHGVCEACRHFGWTERDGGGRYLCPECFGKRGIQPAEPTRYYLQSVSLTPLYIGASLFSKGEIAKMVEQIIEQYKKTRRLPSRPEGNRTVGYDYGLLLYSLAELGHPGAREIFEKMLSILDSTGAWVEYYEDDRPKGTRCRPWESGINLEAAIHYTLKNR
ncbi:MAG: hypothetical protein ACUVXI_06505 [bacterium]